MEMTNKCIELLIDVCKILAKVSSKYIKVFTIRSKSNHLPDDAYID